MKEISAYKTADGLLFDSEKQAQQHEDDLLGEELDGLMKLFPMDIYRGTLQKAIIHAMNNKKELKCCLENILQLLDFNEDTE